MLPELLLEKISQTEGKYVEPDVWHREFFDQVLFLLKKSRLATLEVREEGHEPSDYSCLAGYLCSLSAWF